MRQRRASLVPLILLCLLFPASEAAAQRATAPRFVEGTATAMAPRPDSADTDSGAMLLGGIVGGVSGMFLGGFIGGRLAGDCTGDYCGLGAALLGALVGESIGMALGVHAGNDGGGDVLMSGAAALALGLAGVFVLVPVLDESNQGVWFLVVPVAQLFTTMAIERATTPRPE